MKKILAILASAILALALPVTAQQPTYIAQSGISLLTYAPATSTQTGQSRLPTFSGAGTLTITGNGITGSPSGCTLTLAYVQNNNTSVGAVVSTTSFTPATSVQTFTVSPSPATGDNYQAVYACSSTYPTAGTITASFSPAITSTVASGSVSIVNSGDPCLNPSVAKSSASVAISTATTTSIVAVSGTKAIYVCGFAASTGLSDTLQFEYGTGASCTGTHALTGVMATDATVANYLVLGSNGTLFTAPASNGVCIVSTGTGGINGVLFYVQQ
jgi:hypothetical protein